MGPSLSSIQLLSVWATMAHTSCRIRAKHAGLSPITDAPLLFDRPLMSSGPPRRRARRTMIKLLLLTTQLSIRGSRCLQAGSQRDLAVL
jgi:hypothetical protein